MTKTWVGYWASRMPLSLSVLALLQGLQGTLPVAPMALDHLSTWKPAESKLTDRASSQKVCMRPLHSPGGWRLPQKALLQFTTVFSLAVPAKNQTMAVYGATPESTPGRGGAEKG